METMEGRRNNMRLFANLLSALLIATASIASVCSIFIFLDEPVCPEEFL
jgi:cyclic lactone autoinducer peptide